MSGAPLKGIFQSTTIICVLTELVDNHPWALIVRGSSKEDRHDLVMLLYKEATILGRGWWELERYFQTS